MSLVDVVAAVLLLVGGSLALLAGVGINRFTGVYARMHAATKPATLGLLLVIVAAALRVGDMGSVAKLLLVGVFQLVTAPIAAHLIARAAYEFGDEEFRQQARVDELAERRADGRDG